MTTSVSSQKVTFSRKVTISSYMYDQSFSALNKIACARTETEILSVARAQFFVSLMLALALSSKIAPLNFALIFKRFLEVFVMKSYLFFTFWRSFQKYTFKAKKKLRFKEIQEKYLNFMHQFS